MQEVYLWTQWAAVIMCRSLTRTPAQKRSLSTSHSAAIHGHWPAADRRPPTNRLLRLRTEPPSCRSVNQSNSAVDPSSQSWFEGNFLYGRVHLCDAIANNFPTTRFIRYRSNKNIPALKSIWNLFEFWIIFPIYWHNRESRVSISNNRRL